MSRILAVLMALTSAACGSASTAGPKTTNPPLKKAPPKAADPAEKPEVEQDGLTLKFNKLAFRMTMTPAGWKGGIQRDDDGSAHIMLLRPDLEGVLVLIPIAAKGETAKSIAENQRQLASQDASYAVAAVVDEGKGRHAFTIDRMADGKPARTYLGVVPHPVVPDAFLVAVAHAPTSNADAFLKDVRAVLDSIAPL